VCFSNQDRSAGLVLFPVRVDETIRIAVWEPFATDPVGVEILDEPRSNPALAGAPVQTRGFEIFPAQNGDLCVTSLFAGEVTSIPEAALNQAALLEGDTTAFADASFIDWKVSSSTARHIDKTKHFDAANGDSVFIGESPKVTASATSVTMYRKLEDSHEGHRQSNSDHVLQLASDDEETKEDQLLIVEWGKERRLYTVETVDRTDPTNYIAKVTERIPQAAGTVMYQAVEPCFDGDVRSYPAVDISKVPLSVRQAISSGSLTVDDFEPQRQRGINLEIDGAWTLLSEPWSAKVDPVANAYAVIVQSAAPQWRIYSPMRARNPALSWEYWNGSNWWRIDGLDDTTLDLQQSGDVQFCVPADLKPTDVVGRSNHWIRARLVGGDYGDEKVTIVSETTGNKTTQTIDRSTDNVTAPYVAKFSLSYFVCCLVAPDFIVTKDGGNVLNQSAANQTEDATITAFTPLADFLPDAETAIYLGFDAPIVGGPISVLFKVDERPHDDAFPLRLDVLRRERFEPVICEDNTRGLGETGTLRFNLTTRPELREYFGAKRYWMRVRPREGADLTRWKPAIRAAYLNAVYASAAETQSNEILGSSDGRPDLTARLSRTPVIAGSLKLRVRERLATDEVDALNEAAADTVLTAIPNREGTWVLWKEVPDLLDARPGERIYTLDEDGEIQFGDGLRGMIPPPGVDCILAQGYQRGGGKAANEVRAFSQANLVTSLQGVELAVFVDRAAGGTDSQDIDSTLRFAPAKLRQRNRILTLEDLETSALEFSSDVAQSLALSTSRGVDVYLVMKGGEPLPSAAVRREFQRYVTERVSPDLAAHGVVSAKSPPKVYLRLEIRALIANIDAAGQVASRCKEKIAALLDPVVGGWEGSGWPLGAVPDRADIAACLDDIEHLDELLDFDMAWVAKPGETPNASTAPKLTPQSLILLDTDGFKVVVSISDAEVSA
jgi:hypothetical protein